MGRVHLLDVWYSYPQWSSHALQGVSLEVGPHEKLNIVGGNLAGKTTLANVIVRTHLGQLEGSLTGQINISYKDQETKLIGYLFDDPNWMFCNLQVEDEVAFGLENLSIDPAEISRRVKVALETVGLGGFEKRAVNTLSGGESQKLAIAAALAAEPGVLVTDDLLSNVDVASVSGIVEAIDRFRRSSDCAWIDLSRQWPDKWTQMDRLGFLSSGRLLDVGPTEGVWAKLEARIVGSGECRVPDELEILHRANAILSAQGQALRLVKDGCSGLCREIATRFSVRSPHGLKPSVLRRSHSPAHKPDLRICRVRFGYARDDDVLSDCDFEVVPGAVNVLAGRNGSGKTTLSKICAGLLSPAKGHVFWKGDQVYDRFLRSKVSLVFQNPEYHFLTDTVLEELLLTGRLMRLPSAETNRVAEAILSKLDLRDKGSTNPFTLTIGEKRRLAIGICMMRRPQILFVDEPTLGQDQKQSRLLGRLFLELASEGITPVIVSHDPHFVYEFGERIHVLETGRVVYTGEVPPLFRESAKSDYAGKSCVLSIWEHLSPPNLQTESHPRSAVELLERLELCGYRN